MIKTVYRIRSIIIALAMVCTIYTSAHASFTNTNVVSPASTCTINVPAQDTTIQAAVNTAASGCTINVAAGNFPEQVTVKKTVSIIGAGNDTTKVEGFVVTGSNVVIKGFYMTGVDYGIYSTGLSGDFESNHIYYESHAGIQLALNSDGSKVINNNLQRNGQVGIKVNSNNNLIQGNEVSGSEQCPPTYCGPDADGIYFFGANNTYTGNYIHGITYSDPYNQVNGVSGAPHIDCFQTWNSPGITGTTIIENNICDDPDPAVSNIAMTKGITINNGGSGTLIVRNNVFRAMVGIGEFSDFPKALNIQVYNNTFIGDAGQQISWGASALYLSYANNISQFTNNLIIGKSQGMDINKGASVTGSHNWFYDIGAKESFIGYSPANDMVNIDPQIQANYFLASSSPACGIGAIPCPSSAAVALIKISTPTLVPPTLTSTLIALKSKPTASSVPVLPSATQKILPTATSHAATQPVTEKIYNDTDRYFNFSSRWPLVSNSQAYKGEYKYTDLLRSSVMLTFTGQSLSILYTSGPDYGNMDIYIDNLLVGSLNQKSPDLRFQQHWGYSGQLPSGKHTLKLIFIGPANTEGTLDAVIIH